MDRDTRDLKWCIHSNPLIHIEGDNRWPSAKWFHSLPLPDREFLFEPPANYRLGFRFEALIKAWIEQAKAFELIEANLPVRDAKRTLGEFDLLVRHRHRTEHWELAVKFYLGVGDTTNPSYFFGPNPADTLHTKLQRLRQHQLRLSESEVARSLLDRHAISISQVRGFVKGRLFYPLYDWESGKIQHPDCVDPGHNTGWWCEPGTFARDMPTDHYYAILPKPYWLATIEPNDPVDALDHAAFTEFAANCKDGTLHVVELDSRGFEISRGFIVFPRWQASIPA